MEGIATYAKLDFKREIFEDDYGDQYRYELPLIMMVTNQGSIADVDICLSITHKEPNEVNNQKRVVKKEFEKICPVKF